MFRKVVLFLFLAIIVNNTVFSQSAVIDTVISNAAKEISESVPQGTRIAVLNISSDFSNLSDYIINELIVNLVNTRKFQIVPRSTVELQAANMEFDFQMTGSVSDDSQKRLGQFLGAGTIITGTVTRESANSFRLIINTIDLESFTFQSSFRASFQNNNQVKTLAAGSGGVFYEDYTVGQRFGMGALNIFGGVGSIYHGHKIGWLTTATEIAGIALIVFGGYVFNSTEHWLYELEEAKRREWDDDIGRFQILYDSAVKDRELFLTVGSIVIGAGVVFGFVIPFFHHKPNNTKVSQNDFPFNLELVSSNNQGFNGIRLLYNVSF